MKGSCALPASPHADSVESSGRPSTTLGWETNTADNLLFNGAKEVIVREKNYANPTKRVKSALPEDKKRDVKGSEEPVIFPIGVKSQAYAQRNRSRINRDTTYTGSSDLLGHGRRSLNSLSCQLSKVAKGKNS
ncbi:hypothetical protein QJS04_geneDACA014370 [Acorus gramineus]|uniref:Uncharacterized protein n=1 Tax=Acorus gramineus TaxID=55184 RepID=A0AAV8ZZ20_ACOGR|nr:hypothetical protein QJS04_geneDACA014370 [Acorus gramineus]